MRAIILYPLNALVEDQLGRLRTALDSDNARNWLQTKRAGKRFYFGRYTGTNTCVRRQEFVYERSAFRLLFGISR
jgi:ATP-dependent helicase YprA (DUF1998 family)